MLPHEYMDFNYSVDRDWDESTYFIGVTLNDISRGSSLISLEHEDLSQDLQEEEEEARREQEISEEHVEKEDLARRSFTERRLPLRHRRRQQRLETTSA